ncbi:MAG: type I 3-dehydroquinate dehydratase [Bacteroidales bacterium]|nr:type I 3-dehydroquinate dehydratase [Bacteroidales bacterium]
MICISISDTNLNNCLSLLKNVEMAEIRLDLTEYSTDQIKKVFGSHPRLIATYRPGKESDRERLKKLKTAIKSGAKYLDIEYESNDTFREELIAVAKKQNCEIIISYHNFDETLSLPEMNDIVGRCYEDGADIAKIATTINGKADILRILSLYNRSDRIVAIGMGERGKITRILAPLLGAEFTFASPDSGKETAPGQIPYSKLKELIKSLESI